MHRTASASPGAVDRRPGRTSRQCDRGKRVPRGPRESKDADRRLIARNHARRSQIGQQVAGIGADRGATGATFWSAPKLPLSARVIDAEHGVSKKGERNGGKQQRCRSAAPGRDQREREREQRQSQVVRVALLQAKWTWRIA